MKESLEKKISKSFLTERGRTKSFFRSKTLPFLLGGGLFLGYSPSAAAETIYLTDGKQIEGEIISQDIEGIKVKTEFGEVFIKKGKIGKVEYGQPAQVLPPEAPEQAQVPSQETSPETKALPPRETPQPIRIPFPEEVAPPQMEDQPSPPAPEGKEKKIYRNSGFGLHLGGFIPSDERFDSIYGPGFTGGIDYVHQFNYLFSLELDFGSYYKEGEPEVYSRGISREDIKASSKIFVSQLGAGGRVNIQTNSSAVPYLGFGLDLWIFDEELSAEAGGEGDTVAGSLKAVGFHGSVGLEYVINENLSINPEIRATLVPAKNKLTGEETNLGSVNYTIGMRF